MAKTGHQARVRELTTAFAKKGLKIAGAEIGTNSRLSLTVRDEAGRETIVSATQTGGGFGSGDKNLVSQAWRNLQMMPSAPAG